jgi:hypothetical protein
MKRPCGLCVTSAFEEPLSKTQLAQSWAQFMKGGTQHSARAAILPHIIRRAEQAGISYRLTAHPGAGYYLERIKGE